MSNLWPEAHAAVSQVRASPRATLGFLSLLCNKPGRRTNAGYAARDGSYARNAWPGCAFDRSKVLRMSKCIQGLEAPGYISIFTTPRKPLARFVYAIICGIMR